MIYTKRTRGWVAQQYDSETGDCVRQEFIVDDADPQRVDEGDHGQRPDVARERGPRPAPGHVGAGAAVARQQRDQERPDRPAARDQWSYGKTVA